MGLPKPQKEETAGGYASWTAGGGETIGAIILRHRSGMCRRLKERPPDPTQLEGGRIKKVGHHLSESDEALDPRPSTLDPRPSTLDPRP